MWDVFMCKYAVYKEVGLIVYSVVSRVWWSKSCTPVLTERLVPEGKWFKARAGRLEIDIQDSNHTFEE